MASGEALFAREHFEEAAMIARPLALPECFAKSRKEAEHGRMQLDIRIDQIDRIVPTAQARRGSRASSSITEIKGATSKDFEIKLNTLEILSRYPISQHESWSGSH